MSDIDHHGPAMMSVVAGTAQLQTHVVENRLELALNDTSGTYYPGGLGQEHGLVAGSIRLGREEVKALLRVCADFLVMGN